MKKAKKQTKKKERRKPFWYERGAIKAKGLENSSFEDFAVWLEDDQILDPGFRAVLAADTKEEPDPIILFLKSSEMITPFARKLIADYIDRHRPGKRGKKRMPAYAQPQGFAAKTQAVKHARRLMAKGLSKDEAFEKAAAEYSINLETLHRFATGKEGGARRQKARRSAALKPR